MKPVYFWLLVPIVLINSISVAQSLTGIVRDDRTNSPLPDVTVRLTGGARGTVTDSRGYFAINGLQPGQPTTLLISSVGYQSTEKVVDANSQINSVVVVRLKPTVIQLNQQTVTAPLRTETPDFDRPEITTVLTARDLRQRAPRTVPEALFGATGVWLQKTNHGGGSPFVRGLTGQQTLILVDGIRLNNATFRSGPNQYLNTIDPQQVNRIEVLRGSGSVAYGSDAIGGVVNIQTKLPQFTDQLTVGGSIYGKATTQGMEYSSRAEVNLSTPTVAVLGGIAYRKFGDLVAGKGLGRESPTGYDQVSGDVTARFRLSERWTATTVYQDLRQDSVPVYHRVRLENYRYYQFNPQRRQLTYARLTGLFNRRFLESLQLTGSWQRQTEGCQSQRNQNATAVYERDQTTTTGLTMLAPAAPTRYWQMQNGAEWYFDQVRSSREDVNTQTRAVTPKRGLYPDQATMSSLALFSLHTLTFNRLTLTAGGRYNAFQLTIPEATLGQTSIRPSALVGNLGASVAVLPTLRVVGSVSSAFRAPNLDDLGTLGIVDFRYEVPNASLRPERSRTLEAGLKLRTNRLSATLLAYHNRLTNFITRVRAGTDSIQGYPVYLKQNSAASFIRGLETEVEYQFRSDWLVYAGLTYTYGQNVTAGEPFRRIPPLNGRAGLTYQPAGAGGWVRAELLYAGAQTRLAKGDQDDNRITKGGTPAWQVLNLNGGYRWRWLTLSAELQNLTNEAYRTHGSGVDGMGRSAWLSALVRF